MKRSRSQLLVTALLFAAATQASAQTLGLESSIGQQAKAAPDISASFRYVVFA